MRKNRRKKSAPWQRKIFVKWRQDRIASCEAFQTSNDAVLNDRFGTDFTEEDRLFFEQIKEKASKDEKVIQTARANPKDKFKIGIRKLIEDLMIQRLGENDKIVTRYVEDQGSFRMPLSMD